MFMKDNPGTDPRQRDIREWTQGQQSRGGKENLRRAREKENRISRKTATNKDLTKIEEDNNKGKQTMPLKLVLPAMARTTVIKDNVTSETRAPSARELRPSLMRCLVMIFLAHTQISKIMQSSSSRSLMESLTAAIP